MGMSSTYFAKDGSYGRSSGMIVVDTTGWTEADWEEVENAYDDERVSVADAIHRKERSEDV
jgi:hypothetical protein